MKELDKIKEIVASRNFQNFLIFAMPAIILFPFFIGHLLHSDLYFTGYLMNAHDQNIYFGFMKQAQDGYWRLLNLPSNILHPREYIHTLFLLQGLLSRITGIPLVYVHLLSSYCFAVFFGLVIRVLCIKVFKRDIFATLAIAVMLFGSGFGVLGKVYSTVFKHEITVKNMSAFPGDLWMPEMTVWNSICYTPLFIWSYLLIILIYGGIWFGELKKSFYPFIISAVAVLLIALSHSYDLVPLGFISLILLILFRVYNAKQDTCSVEPGKESCGSSFKRIYPYLLTTPVFLGYCLYAIFFLGSMGYQYYVLKNNAGFSVWAAKNVNLAPDFTVILMGFGVLSLGYIEIIIRIVDWGRNRNTVHAECREDEQEDFASKTLLVRFLGWWLVIQTMMLYSPFPFARRFILAIFIPLVIFFILFLKRLSSDRKILPILVTFLLVLTTFLTPLYQLLANSVKVIKGDERYFYSEESVDAYRSLNHGLDDSDVVFASFHQCNNLLRFSPAAMIAGSTQQCSEDVQKSIKSFFEGDDIPLKPFLKDNRVSFIFLNKEDDAIFINKQKSLLDSLDILFENRDFIVYETNTEK